MSRPVSERPYSMVSWEPSMTKQEFAEETSISYLIEKFGLAACVEFGLNSASGAQGLDCVGLPSLEEYHAIKRSTLDFYEASPADVKARYRDAFDMASNLTEADAEILFGKKEVSDRGSDSSEVGV